MIKRRLIGMMAVVLVLSALLVTSPSASATEPRCDYAKRTCNHTADVTWNECIASGQYQFICWIVYQDTYTACLESYMC